MTEPKADVSLELLTKIAALFAIYLVAQGYGYAFGSTTEPPKNLYDAISHGVFHMKSFLRPWDEVAWPLSPFLCGLMLVYTPYLPSQLREKHGSMAASANRSFFALFVAVSLVHITAVWVSDWAWFIENMQDQAMPSGHGAHYPQCPIRDVLCLLVHTFLKAHWRSKARIFHDSQMGLLPMARDYDHAGDYLDHLSFLHGC